MFFLLALLASVWNQITTFSQPSAVIELTEKKGIMEPGLLGILQRERVFNSLDNSKIRLPFGGNIAAIKQLADPAFVENQKYQRAYQMNLKNILVDTARDAKLPASELMNERSHYGGYTLREPTFQKINDSWKRSKQREERWRRGWSETPPGTQADK